MSTPFLVWISTCLVGTVSYHVQLFRSENFSVKASNAFMYRFPKGFQAADASFERVLCTYHLLPRGLTPGTLQKNPWEPKGNGTVLVLLNILADIGCFQKNFYVVDLASSYLISRETVAIFHSLKRVPLS